MLPLILLIISLGVLIKGADILIDGASALAKSLKVPPIAIGMTVVAFGTSLPELMVNLIAVMNGQVGLSFGNILGSNITNILLIIGIAGLISPIKVKYSTVWKEVPFTILVTFILFVMVNDLIFDNSPNVLSRTDGIVLMVLFFIFLYYTFGLMENKEFEQKIKDMGTFLSFLYILVGIVCLIGGAHFAVHYSVELMHLLNIPGEVIGLTVIALGTSLPELITGIAAAKKQQIDILIGDIVGSNVFNITFILGISSILHPLSYNISLNIDLIISLLASYILFVLLFTGKEERTIERWESLILLCLYIIYLVSIWYRL